MKHGFNALKSPRSIAMLELQTLNSYEKFEDWIFQINPVGQHPNEIHELSLYQEPWKTRFTETQKIKIAGWIQTLFKYERIKMIRSKVKFYNIKNI